MVIHTMYKRKIKHYNHIFNDTVRLYRGAVDYLISVCMDHWTEVAAIPKELERKTYVESMIHKTKDNPVVPYDFDDRFYKFPSGKYLPIKAALQHGNLLIRRTAV